MGALLALISSVAWGSADVAGGLGARRVGSVRVIAVNYPAGAIILTAFALLVVPGTIDREVILLSMVTAIVGTIAYLFRPYQIVRSRRLNVPTAIAMATTTTPCPSEKSAPQ